MATQFRSSKHDSNSQTVPKVRLYVERPEAEESWFVNVGHVTDRGRWKTDVHSHPDYGQVIFVRSGSGAVNLEGRAVPFQGPCVLLLPTETVHGMRYDMDVDRWVVTIDVTYLKQVNTRLPEFSRLWAAPLTIPLADESETAQQMFTIITQLGSEIANKPSGHVVGTEALLTLLLLMLVRRSHLNQVIPEDGPSPKESRLVERFRELIEQHYRQHLQLQNYASMLAVSLVQLRTACAAVAAQSPTKMIHARLITEAKRHLIFGEMSMEQIAFGLGFSDAAYFTRFFRKEVGQSPSQFRITARHQPHAASA
ncbi:helix-turn-helix domain-containing protein (plasmid) [Diaphorobacter sp. HDW4B]|uniref:helix-turn-helix domain-containing protein n=1 Tax=Diaphorobacter sp. HDW4B TaxID=2714925 RepID=UPI00140ABDF6|nr:helix-turn-helix domain-containing protein [Diaphorobacter sp. HDW4B]QIL73865.1 helix-turn-helix domain-containing protein [Diaphorobacter sp. HDW4B]